MTARTDSTLGYATDRGRDHAFNQDKLGFYRPDDPRLADAAGSVFVVADGQGTGERGTALADLAIRTLVRAYYGAVREYGRSDALAVAMLAADRALRQALAQEPDRAATGVTLVAIVVRGDELIVGHVGDPRAYLVRDGRAYCLTDDATDATAGIGHGPTPRPVILDGIPLGSGDRVVLCSDGVYQTLGDDQIASAITGHEPNVGARRLVALAAGRAGGDDMTALVLQPFEPRAIPAPVAPPQEVHWPTVFITAGTLILLFALFIFRREIQGAVANVRFAEPTAHAPIAVAIETVPALAATVTAAPTESPTPATPTPIAVPNVVGRTAEDAEQIIRGNYLGLDLIRQYHATIAPGFVISQSPEAGTVAAREAVVQVAVSLGPEAAALPTRAILPTRVWPTWTTVPLESPTLATPVPALTETPTNPPPGGGGEEKPDKPKPPQPTVAPPTAPPPPPPTDEPKPTDKPDPPTPKPQPPTPGAQNHAGDADHGVLALVDAGMSGGGVGGRIRGLASPIRDPEERILTGAPQGAPQAGRGDLSWHGPPFRREAPPWRAPRQAPQQDMTPTVDASPTADATPTVDPPPTVDATSTTDATADATPTADAPPTDTATPEPEWLARVNYHRAIARVLAVNPEAEWSVGAALHSRYLVMTDALTTTEDPTSPFYTEAGSQVGARSIVARSRDVNWPTERTIDGWLADPLRGVQVLDPRLTVAGFGDFREAVGTYHYAATLDVESGLQATPPPGLTFPLRYPDTAIPQLQFLGDTAAPNPLTHCQGYVAPTGPAIYLLLGPGDGNPQVEFASLRRGARVLDLCIFTESTYTNPDPAEQARGREILGARDAVVLLPREPLDAGRQYNVVIKILGGELVQWSFTAGVVGGQTPTPQPPPPTATNTPTNTPTPTPTNTPTDTPTHTSTPTPTNTSTSTPTATSTPTNTPTPTPRPAYLPILFREQWLTCALPWSGVNDDAPFPLTNDTPGLSQLGPELCLREEYLGHLWRNEGTLDREDWFLFHLRRPGGVRVVLDVPKSAADYDLALWKGQPFLPDDPWIAKSDNPAGVDEVIDLRELPPSAYWIQIYTFGAQIEAPYQLTWDYR